jgi:hypothetical protein
MKQNKNSVHQRSKITKNDKSLPKPNNNQNKALREGD